jgi:hypothetical protein
LKSFSEAGYGCPGVGSAGGALLVTDDSGTSVHLSIDVSTFLPFTMTTYDNSSGETHTYDRWLPIYLEQDNISISDDWGVFSDSFQADVAGGGMAQISWNQFSAEPPFDKDSEPR